MHEIDANDLKAIAIVQSCWIKATKTQAVFKLWHVLRYLRNRDAYIESRERKLFLERMNAKHARKAFENRLVVDLS